MEKYHWGKELEGGGKRKNTGYPGRLCGICQCGKYFKKDYEDRDA